MSRLQQLALTLLPGIGAVHARKLLDHYRNEEVVFSEAAKRFPGLPVIGEKLVRSFTPAKQRLAFEKAEAELNFIEKAGIRLLFYLDAEYPSRLKHCYDAPVILFYRGNAHIDHPRVLSIVGTRRATSYGKMLCESLVEGLSCYDPLIISGLAYGIDVTAHRAALKNGLATIGVLGHGMNRIYPAAHVPVSREMEKQGGLLSEFPHETLTVPENFPKRNRIVAGLSDATIVVEAGEKGGALITADIASGYDREVFAVPGRPGDEHSAGCLRLIRDHKAQLITNARDVAWCLGWDMPPDSPGLHGAASERPFTRRNLSRDLSGEELEVLRIIKDRDGILIDNLAEHLGFEQNMLYSIILSLELGGFITNVPGIGYKIVNKL